jgi:hypothetical protein
MQQLFQLDALMALCLGIGLASAAGFRIFVPPLVLGIAQRLGAPLTDTVPDWIGSWPALIAFGSASLVEVGAYYVPWLDNALDAIASPVAVLAGILLTGLVLSELPPLIGWSLAVIAGGGAAAVTQAATVVTRALSTGTTAGFGNFLVASAELVLAVFVAVLAVLIAPAALGALALGVVWLIRLLRRKSRAKPAPA